MIEKNYQPSEIERRVWAAWERRAGVSRRPAGPRPRPSPIASSSRRPTSPAPCTWGMRSTIRCRTCCAGSSACAAATCCGSPEPITPASPPRWWSSASSWSARSPPAAPWAARNSSSGCGSGRPSPAASSSTSSSGSAPPATGRASASPWTRASRGPSSRCSSSSTMTGLIYKDKRLVNWDPKLLTAISDLEVQQVETKGHLWHIKYPIEGSDEFIVVATTRPETMLGDTAVAVHPDNERLKHLIGKTAVLPLVGRRIKIIGDDYADPEKGTGAVKITPAHDFNDFEVGRRHHLAMINVLDVEGKARPRRQYRVPGRRAGIARTRRDARPARPRSFRRAQEDRRAPGSGGPRRQDRAAHAHGAPWRPLRRGDRALPHRSMVRRRQDAGAPGDRGGARRHDRVRAEELGKDLFRVDGEHPALVHLAAIVVGPPNSRLVRTGRQGVRRRDRGRGGVARARLLRGDRGDHADAGPRHGARPGEPRAVPDPRRGRARHLVLLRAVGVLDARLAGPDSGARALLSRPTRSSPASTSSSSGSRG